MLVCFGTGLEQTRVGVGVRTTGSYGMEVRGKDGDRSDTVN